MRAETANKTECESREFHFIHEARDNTVPGLLTASGIATASTPPTEPTTAHFRTKQTKDPIFRRFASTVGTLGSSYASYCNRALIQVVSIYGAIQKFLLRLLQARFLHEYYYPQWAVQQAERSLYEPMQHEVYWPHIANDVYTFVTDCCECTQIRGSEALKRHF